MAGLRPRVGEGTYGNVLNRAEMGTFIEAFGGPATWAPAPDTPGHLSSASQRPVG